ncbi:MAG: PhzF family phenazine biosynthesis protein [Candidatus Vecturithrix sp.]|nr:PhzF family phenazine biosynthesis protein [Candidatus Vecturithrix sp.]
MPVLSCAMKAFTFKKIDAFATEHSSGNPAGVVYLQKEDEITEDEMQRIARELKGFVSEVGYAWQIAPDTFDLRYYSSEREVEFCGHATIAMMYDLIQQHADLLQRPFVNINTAHARLLVENRIPQENAVFISAPKPTFFRCSIEKSELAAALRVSPDGLNDDLPLANIHAGLKTLIVPVNNLQMALAIHPDLEELKQFCLNHALDILTVFTDNTVNSGNAYRTRVFAPTFGYLEDPATGSGNSAFGYYLLEQRQWDGRLISLEQNGLHDQPNIVKLLAKPDEDHVQRVWFGGSAIVRIQGEYLTI